jgi:hypothetical protein
MRIYHNVRELGQAETREVRAVDTLMEMYNDLVTRGLLKPADQGPGVPVQPELQTPATYTGFSTETYVHVLDGSSYFAKLERNSTRDQR